MDSELQVFEFMELLTKILLGLFFVIAITLVVLILLQRGRGSDLGAVFGGGSQSVFGSRGAANFMTRLTAVLATVFFGIALGLAYIYNGAQVTPSVTESVLETTIDESEVPEVEEQVEIETTENSEVPQAPESNSN